jgi:small subunit ribosomal protein S16
MAVLVTAIHDFKTGMPGTSPGMTRKKTVVSFSRIEFQVSPAEGIHKDMSLRIRLSRAGTKKRPFYRIVIADSRNARDGRFIERIGNYNPMVAKDHPERLTFNAERAKYWLSVGALPSDRVARFCADAGLIEAPKVPQNQTKKNQPKAKAQERLKAAAEAAAKLAEDEAAKAAAPAADAPAGE